jgi:hypothetical protein
MTYLSNCTSGLVSIPLPFDDTFFDSEPLVHDFAALPLDERIHEMAFQEDGAFSFLGKGSASDLAFPEGTTDYLRFEDSPMSFSSSSYPAYESFIPLQTTTEASETRYPSPFQEQPEDILLDSTSSFPVQENCTSELSDQYTFQSEFMPETKRITLFDTQDYLNFEHLDDSSILDERVQQYVFQEDGPFSFLDESSTLSPFFDDSLLSWANSFILNTESFNPIEPVIGVSDQPYLFSTQERSEGIPLSTEESSSKSTEQSVFRRKKQVSTESVRKRKADDARNYRRRKREKNAIKDQELDRLRKENAELLESISKLERLRVENIILKQMLGF